jgi:hypothetical protein
MVSVKVTCNTGKTWETRINTTLQGARDYFMRQTFVDEADDGTETKNTVVGVQLVCAGFVPLTNSGDYVGAHCCNCGEIENDHVSIKTVEVK